MGGSTHGSAVAAGHPDTVAAAAETLAAGGNAYDAVVAAGFAAAVAEPTLTSLGGGGFLLARTAAGEETLVDFFVDTPGVGLPPDALEPHFTPVTVAFTGAEQVFHVGWGSVATPGCLDGFLHVHRRFGRLDLATVVAPAHRLARQGVVVSGIQAHILGMLQAVVTLTDEAAAVFAPGGRLLREGDVLRNEAYAGFLESVAAGRVTGLGSPAVGTPLVAAMARHGGLVTAADLTAYRVVEREPLAVSYRGWRLLTNPPPSFGGTLIEHALRGLAAGPPVGDDADGEHRLAAALVAMGMRHGEARLPRDAPGSGGPRSRKGTTHVAVVDRDGNVASMTTSNGSCSGVMAPGTGIQLNNIMGEDDLHPDGFHASPAGLRVGSMMAPSLLLRDGGRRAAGRAPDAVVLGSGGSERIRSAIAQFVVGVVDRGLELQEAADRPRCHWDGTTLQVEPGHTPGVLEHLAASWPTNEWPGRNLYFGGVHAVGVTADGVVSAAGDPRRGGSTWRG